VKSKIVIERRLDEINKDCRRFTSVPFDTLSDKQIQYVNRLADEENALRDELATLKKATSMANYASPAEWGLADRNPGDNDNGCAFKGFGPGMENRIRPTSMYQIDKAQINALRQASLQGTSFRVQLGQKGIEHGFLGGMRDKAALTESGLTPNLLPPIQQYGPQGWFSLPYENTRVANFLVNVAAEGAGVAWFRHSSNGAEAAYTAEAALKPDLSPVISEQYTRFSKCAGRILLTHELVQDAGDAFANNLVADLARSVYNAESNLILNGTVGTNGFAGINQVSGTLTRTLGTDSPLDCLSKAFQDLRTNFFEPDLCIVNPGTMGALRRVKDTQNRYLLESNSGPRGIDQNSETETLWGVQVVQTTQQSAGTAAVLSVQSGAAVVYVREALTTFFDPYSQASSNIYQYIAETRLALATPRVGAINIVSGLPTS
jgi:hypothetical protein